jgi:excisionase family DNA binding protein
MSARLAYSLKEAAEAVGLSVRSLRYLVAAGKVGFCRVGRRVLIPHVELERLLRKASVKATEPLDAVASYELVIVTHLDQVFPGHQRATGPAAR